MAVKRTALWLCMLCMALCTHAMAQSPSAGRALLIGVDDFVSRPSAYPSSTNNVYAMQELFQSADMPMEALIIPAEPVADAQTLTQLIQDTFAGAEANDVSYLYISTHGQYEPEPALLFSDGVVENAVTPAQLEKAFEGIGGTKVIILDACNSGAFIGKGLASMPETVHFLGEDFKVLASSGALEESWYWEGEGAQGAFYFTQALVQALGAQSGCPADSNRDGAVTLSELYRYLLSNHAASTPQVYPQADDTAIFLASSAEPREHSPVMDVTFSGSTLSRDGGQVSIEFIATRPVRIAYQIVCQRDGRWEFDNAQLIYDGAERFTAPGDEPGQVSAGHKVRTVRLNELDVGTHGYVLVQLVSIDEGKLTVHAGRVLCVPPAGGDLHLTADVSPVLHPASGQEMSIFIGHDFPCDLSVAILDENDTVVHRVCHRQSTRPTQLTPAGSVFYWDGRLRDQRPAAPGRYRVRAQAHLGDATITVLSASFTIQ